MFTIKRPSKLPLSLDSDDSDRHSVRLLLATPSTHKRITCLLYSASRSFSKQLCQAASACLNIAIPNIIHLMKNLQSHRAKHLNLKISISNLIWHSNGLKCNNIINFRHNNENSSSKEFKISLEKFRFVGFDTCDLISKTSKYHFLMSLNSRRLRNITVLGGVQKPCYISTNIRGNITPLACTNSLTSHRANKVNTFLWCWHLTKRWIEKSLLNQILS